MMMSFLAALESSEPKALERVDIFDAPRVETQADIIAKFVHDCDLSSTDRVLTKRRMRPRPPWRKQKGPKFRAVPARRGFNLAEPSQMARDRLKSMAFSGDLTWRGVRLGNVRSGESHVVRRDNVEQHAPQKRAAVLREAHAMSSILAHKPLHQVGALPSKIISALCPDICVSSVNSLMVFAPDRDARENSFSL